MNQKETEVRYRAIGGIVIAVFALLSARLWYLQVIEGEANLNRSNRVRTYSIPIAAPRGVMYDRNGTPLVASRLAYSVTAVPEDVLSNPATLERLAKILNIDRSELSQTLQKRQQDPWRKKSEPVRVAADISADTAMRVEEALLDMPGVDIAREPVRDYIYGDLASHLVGYIHEISPQELEQVKGDGYKQGDNIGKTGLERTYEEYLRGESGGTEIEVDKTGRLMRVLREVYPKPGKDLHLTINLQLQQAAEKALVEQLQYLQKNTQYTKARAGAVVVMDPRNGDILAMTSKPSFDPNLFVGSMPAETSRRLFTDPYRPFTNRALYGQYAPGSTFKPITVLAALETGRAGPKDTFLCEGIDISGKKCWIYATNPRGHGIENLVEGLKNSCNIVMYNLARRVGVENLARYARMFGFGKPTGLDLYPGEKNGLVPDREYKQRAFKGDLAIWRPNETLDFSIGQGFLLTTPLQLAQMYSAIANGGTLYAPRLVSRIATSEGSSVRTYRPKVSGRIDIDQKNLGLVVQGLTKVISEGTAAGVFSGFPLDKYPVAGKTGTAQMTGYDNNGVFAAFGPVGAPSIVVVVVIEQAGSGSRGTGPVARKILEAYFNIDTAKPATAKKPAATPTPSNTASQAAPSGVAGQTTTPTAAATAEGGPSPETPSETEETGQPQAIGDENDTPPQD